MTDQNYNPTLRAKMLEKMLAPDARSISDLAAESGISKSTLYTWKSRAATVGGMTTSNSPRRPDDWPIDEKIRALADTSVLTGAELGAFLRKNGLHESDLKRWKKQVGDALGGPGSKKAAGKSPEAKRVKELERELRRKDKALAEAAALLVLKKKAQALLGDEDDDMLRGSGK